MPYNCTNSITFMSWYPNKIYRGCVHLFCWTGLVGNCLLQPVGLNGLIVAPWHFYCIITYIHTSRLLDQIGPKGQLGENIESVCYIISLESNLLSPTPYERLHWFNSSYIYYHWDCEVYHEKCVIYLLLFETRDYRRFLMQLHQKVKLTH